MALIILDRDGVINEDSDDYIKSPAEWNAIPGSLEAIARLNRHNYQVVVVTNQSGIGRRKLSVDDLNEIHLKMHAHLSQFGGMIDAIFFCPCTPREDCDCRKPKPGMFNQVADRLRVPMSKVFCVGDKMTDVQAARSAGGKPILVKTGKGQREIDEGNVPEGIPIYADLATFVNEIVVS